MLNEFHLIRPYWLAALLPLMIFAYLACRHRPRHSAWDNVCDPHLLPYLIQTNPQDKRFLSLILLLTSAFLMVLGLTGPSWSRFPVPIYKQVQPRVLLLDMSEAMLETDLAPNRLNRAKFKLHDVFSQRKSGQFGLIVYTGEPFVASPLTDDSQTIDALLPMLTNDIMPVAGHHLDSALIEAKRLFTQAGFHYGQILVMTSRAPTPEDIDTANKLQDEGLTISVMPILSHDKAINPLFERFASAGGGELIPMTDTSEDLNQWLNTSRTHHQFTADSNNDTPIWRDQGRWFIIPALLFLLPVFRRGWIQRVSS